MTAALSVRNLSLTYLRAPAPALKGVSLEVAPGERILVTGPSGAGKSSLALCWNGIIPQAIPAELEGTVELAGRDVSRLRIADLARDIAYVFQDADSQICTLTVEDEVAFALENRSLPPAEIGRRVDLALGSVGLSAAMRRRDTRTLSGGEKQKLVLAAALAQDTPIYVFDEPTAQLDPEATRATYAVIDRLARAEAGRSLVYIDHKIEDLLPLTDRVLLLGEDGAPIALEAPAELFHDRGELVAESGTWLPVAARLYRFLRNCGVDLPARPLTVAAALADLDERIVQAPDMRQAILAGVTAWVGGELAPRRDAATKEVLRVDGVSYAPDGAPEIVTDVSLTLGGGEILGLIGRNGAGKSTLGLIIAGLLRPSRGVRTVPADVKLGDAKTGDVTGQFVFQNPEHQFLCETVLDEIMLSLSGKESAGVTAEASLRSFGLWSKRDAHPFQLSQGQKRRLSFLAAILAPERPVLVLDEPSYGLDARAAQRLRQAIIEARRPDQAIVVISHDLDWLAGLGDRVAVMDRGCLVRTGAAQDMLSDARMLADAGLALPQVIVIKDWLDARR